MIRTVLAALLPALLVTVAAAPVWAKQGDARLGFFAGTTALRAGGKTTTGTALGLSWGLEIQDDVLWSIGITQATTDSTEQAGGQTITLTADTTTVQTGITVFFRASKAFVPFVGGGVSVASYEIDHSADPNSEIGDSSGTAGGVFARAGFELRMGRSFTLIPQYHFSAHSIRDSRGGSSTLISDGLLLSFRFAI